MSSAAAEASDNINQAETNAVEVHGRLAADAETIWVDGLNALLRGMDGYQGHKIDADYEHVVVALFTKAWNSLYCAHYLALRGYHMQALNLMRQPIEDWAAYWYLRNFPERWTKFADPSVKTPRFNDLIQAVEGKHKHAPDPTVRAWIDHLHPFSHVDWISVRMVTDEKDGGLYYRLGPEPDELAFRFCASEAVTIISALLGALDNFLRQVRRGGISSPTAYQDRVMEWQETQARAYPHLTASASSSEDES